MKPANWQAVFIFPTGGRPAGAVCDGLKPQLRALLPDDIEIRSAAVTGSGAPPCRRHHRGGFDKK